MKCEAFGNPAPDITWMYNGVALVDANIHPAVSATKMRTGSTLRVAPVNVSHDGYYSCMAVNILGMDQAWWTLVVYGKAKYGKKY